MKKLTVVAAVLCVFMVAQAAVAQDLMIILDGDGSWMIDGATYSGTLMGQMMGSWTIDIDDSLWPADTDSTARFNYVWETFFADNYYDGVGAEGWFGYFNSGTLPTAPTFTFTTTVPGAGTISGNCSMVVLVRDWYADGVLQQDEKHHNSNIDCTLSVNPTVGTGYWTNRCGHGSASSGWFNFLNPPTLDDITLNGHLDTYACPSPVEDASWGTIKGLYK